MTKFREGCDVVYGVRNKRDTDTWFKRTTAEGFYKVMHLLGVDVVFNHADYRLMSQRALEALSEYREENLFLRGIVPLIGYRSDYVYYDRHERFAGESKYPLKKMISFALDGITSFSVKPLKLISNLGILISVLSIFGLLYALISYFAGVAVSGWTAIVCSIWLLGGLQMLCLGVVGGYIGKIYSEVKARPRYRVEEYLEQDLPENWPATEEERDYASVLAKAPHHAYGGQCTYCGHCAPCPAGIDIAMVNKLYDLATMQPEVPATVKAHYGALSATAADCIACGGCETRCPFGVPVVERMEKAKALFG